MSEYKVQRHTDGARFLHNSSNSLSESDVKKSVNKLYFSYELEDNYASYTSYQTIYSFIEYSI